MAYKTLALTLLLTAGSLHAQAPEARERLLVQPAWLAQHLDDPDLVLLHVGPRPEYDAGHIPGARYLNYQDLAATDRAPGGLTLQMLPAEELRQRLASLGISNTSRIVLYFGRENPFVSPTARVMFTLDYAGLGDRTSLLDGGLEAWVKDGHPLSTDAPPDRTGTLAPLAPRPLVVDAEFVKANLAARGIAIVDGRNAGFYHGTQTGGGPNAKHKTGHIQGAGNVPFGDTVDAANRLRPAAELQKLFASAGVEPGDTAVAYCHIGQQATQVILAARSLGYRVLLYDGSFEEWSRKDYPVEK
ncbi:MAG: sulfurtransferase [Acidobacteria bacterium]|nr:sulfurtransferase [Acidobacteriota bacterium]